MSQLQQLEVTVCHVLGVVRTIGRGRPALTSACAPTVSMIQQEPVRVIFARPKEAGAVVIGGLKRVLLSGACHLHFYVTRSASASGRNCLRDGSRSPAH